VVINRVLNAGTANNLVVGSRTSEAVYFLHSDFYKELLELRSKYEPNAGFAQFVQTHDQRRLSSPPRKRRLEEARDSISNDLSDAKRIAPPSLSQSERSELAQKYRQELLAAIGLSSDMVEQRMSAPGAKEAMREAWKALDGQGKKNEMLERFLREFQNFQDEDLSRAHSDIVSSIGGDDRKRIILDEVDARVRDDLVFYMLFPEVRLVDHLIEQIESAAQHDDGLLQGEQKLKDQLKFVRQGLGELNLSNPRSWDEIRQRISPGYSRPGYNDVQNLFKGITRRSDDET
jgi:hypothetical protein